MQEWIQYNLQGDMIEPTASSENETLSKEHLLALSVQLSVARLDDCNKTLQLVGELCTAITGVSYPFDAEIIRFEKADQRKKAVETSIVEASKPKKRRGRPKGKADTGRRFMD